MNRVYSATGQWRGGAYGMELEGPAIRAAAETWPALTAGSLGLAHGQAPAGIRRPPPDPTRGYTAGWTRARHGPVASVRSARAYRLPTCGSHACGEVRVA